MGPQKLGISLPLTFTKSSPPPHHLICHPLVSSHPLLSSRSLASSTHINEGGKLREKFLKSFLEFFFSPEKYEGFQV